jgi:hypothetical protein
MYGRKLSSHSNGKGAGTYVKQEPRGTSWALRSRPRDVRDKLMAAGDVGARPAGCWELQSAFDSIHEGQSHAYQGFEDEVEGASHHLVSRCTPWQDDVTRSRPRRSKRPNGDISPLVASN